MAIQVLEHELTNGLLDIPIQTGFECHRVLVRFNHEPIGWVKINSPDTAVITAAQLAEAIKKQLGKQLLLKVQHNNLATPQQRIFTLAKAGISIVVCTRNRTHHLATCINSLLALDYPDYEIIVVDNAPTNRDTYHFVADLPVRYVLEERPGLNWARNRGITEARHDIIAFTDDDARVDQFWLQAISDTFSNPSLTAVTGYVAPAELDTEAQVAFELGYGGMGHGFHYRILSAERLSKQQLIRTSSVGIGVNMAFRRSAIQQIGSFDTALDVGTPSNGAGDIELFYRLLTFGHKIAYNPSMLVWHTHRRHFKEVRKQVMDNGRSFGCYLITCLRKHRVKTPVIIKYLLNDWLLKWNLKNLVKPKENLPRAFALFELFGMLQSPFAWKASQKVSKRIRTQEKYSNFDPEASMKVKNNILQ